MCVISKKDMKNSKFMSLILRHKPQEANLILDEYGYANISDLIKGMRDKGYKITIEDVERIVREDNKKRYSFNSDNTKIRANQGHSIRVNLELQSIQPPSVLYHGTSIRFRDNILKEGVKKQSRQYVHLSSDIDTAINVGKRHGSPIIFLINSKEMFEDGYKFYLSENKVWLTDYVPIKYIKIIN
ncbi:RNA 2'-phosphotransferase [Clostridium botulinum]|uniref:RNA 2'-phosphotransferase n=1 Tax=Clostridium botulinum TaxID=1491 RepID=UPI00057C4DFE|nr:RNA 2'-phosphotransferase [Clostridium botulinum]NFO98296.1 RNA 2'-phosphotransferase [Clostridium botulinum]OOV52413.1 RNA 2'-phosphotransferase [Clostridium botulinum D/C]OOV55717.1 RNA 2'-phosphotransferase [Clostridium botulinum D/C]OOV57164.1 RNA 2'-phosphotransferase [Clostridium botulinum D/C]